MSTDRFAHDPLARAIREALLMSPDLLKDDYRDSTMPYAGHCYVASETYYFLRGGRSSGLKPVVVRHEGGTHWWLVDAAGAITDLTLEQFHTPVPYAAGRGCGFQNRDPDVPSQRTQTCIARVTAAHPEIFRRSDVRHTGLQSGTRP